MKIVSHGEFDTRALHTHTHTRARTPRRPSVGRVIGKNTGGPEKEEGSERGTGEREKRDVYTKQKHREENGRRSTVAGYEGSTRGAGRGKGSGSAIKRGEIQGAHEGGVGRARHPSRTHNTRRRVKRREGRRGKETRRERERASERERRTPASKEITIFAYVNYRLTRMNDRPTVFSPAGRFPSN